MFYRPNFCTECGEKIERTEWYVWTSRRFCEDCSKTFQATRFLPKVIGGILFLSSGILVGSQISGKSNLQNLSVSKGDAANVTVSVPESKQLALHENNVQNADAKPITSLPKSTPTASIPAINKTVEPQQMVKNGNAVEVSETVYFCGAITKKGTLCSRKVKNGGRCWQHLGQSAGLAQEKLRVQ